MPHRCAHLFAATLMTIATALSIRFVAGFMTLQKVVARTYQAANIERTNMTDRTEAMDNLIAQDADLIDTAAEWQAGYEAGVEAAAKALEDDAKKCDCFARNEGECGCGAWCDWKSITSARAVEIVRALKDKSK